MQRCIALMKLSHKGVTDVSPIHQQLADAANRLEKMGGRMTDLYATTGDYDYVGIARVPNDRVARDFISALSTGGYLSTTPLIGQC